MIKRILKKKLILEDVLNIPIDTVSMHRPSKRTWEEAFIVPKMIRSYGTEFFNDLKYLSDSHMRWREDVDTISGTYS